MSTQYMENGQSGQTGRYVALVVVTADSSVTDCVTTQNQPTMVMIVKVYPWSLDHVRLDLVQVCIFTAVHYNINVFMDIIVLPNFLVNKSHLGGMLSLILCNYTPLCRKGGYIVLLMSVGLSFCQ